MVGAGVCGGLRARVGVRFPPGRVAFRATRGGLVAGRTATLVAGRQGRPAHARVMFTGFTLTCSASTPTSLSAAVRPPLRPVVPCHWRLETTTLWSVAVA